MPSKDAAFEAFAVGFLKSLASTFECSQKEAENWLCKSQRSLDDAGHLGLKEVYVKGQDLFLFDGDGSDGRTVTLLRKRYGEEEWTAFQPPELDP